MFKKLLELLEKLKASDANKSEIKAIEAQIAKLKEQETEVDTLKTEHSTYKQVVDVVGDRDIGELIGFSDAMKKIDLDTPEKIIALKAKADGDTKTATEQTAEIATLKAEIEKGSETTKQVKIDSEKALLLADVKIGLANEVGQATLFNLAIDAEMKNEKFTRNSDGSISYGGKSLAESVEGLRKTYGSAFKELPQGSGGNGGSVGNKPDENNNNKPTMADRLKKGFK
ncbi:MAG: hypothetical protein U9N61_01665 [Euryarchaeota archaeon]|nr:hypothetical protein [Euryarchaeota archaeon]